MTLDSLPDLDTSGLCLVKTLSTALTCWPYRNTALRDGARTSTRTSSVAKWRTASIHCRPAPPRQTEALSSRTSRSRPWKRRSQAVRERKTSVLRACRVPNPAKRLNVVQRPKTLFVERLPRHGQRRRAGGPPGVTTARTSMAIECEHTPGRRTLVRQGQVLRVKALTIEKITVERDGEHHYSLGPARSTHDGHGPLKISDVLGVANDSAPNGDTLVKMPCGCDRILFAN